ncbi:suppressor of fused domain protein [Glycomyces tritici]|uniref:Suppressor of fused domain protein n=1 Tax=Glycomyces tritici TaxID=2665176 RepID=A0ABT7YUM3_9ACTN|nr:suppressor of fused domain protein [Glycomyces tritici]MDN3241546.1 suppressor of fused domain protein [Glycomyces tritici]MDN3242333.1 suppressor of fused domain protein [Glycomyces tritici]
MAISEADQRVGFKVADAFDGGEFDRVARFWTEDESAFVDVAEYGGSPGPGIASYSTLGLSAAPLMDGDTQMPFGVEICGAADDGFDLFPNILASAAFQVLDGEFVYPDRILGGIVEGYYPDLEMKHLLFMSPFLWGDRLQSFDAAGRQVAFLQAVPISNAELELAMRTSVDEMTDLMMARGAEPTDLARASVV